MICCYLKFLPVKLRDAHVIVTLLVCHYSLYKKSFVNRNLFDAAY